MSPVWCYLSVHMYASTGAHAILQGGMLTAVPLSSAVSDRIACSLGRSLFEDGREWMSSYCFRFRIGLCIILIPAVAVFGMHVWMFSLESNSARDNVSPWIERLFCSIFPTMFCGPKLKQDLVCRNDKQRQTSDPQVESFSVDIVGPRSSCASRKRITILPRKSQIRPRAMLGPTCTSRLRLLPSLQPTLRLNLMCFLFLRASCK